MASDKEKDGDSGESGSGTGGQGGRVQFVDFTDTLSNKREDQLTEQDKKRLLGTHQDIHESKVKQQKEKMDHNKDLKNGKITLAAHRAGLMGGGSNAQFKANPALADKAQFSGIDKQVIALPTENLDETNPELRDAYELKYRYQPYPKFNPKPSGPF